MDKPDFDVRMLKMEDYALIITVANDAKADVYGRVPRETVVEILRRLLANFEQG